MRKVSISSILCVAALLFAVATVDAQEDSDSPCSTDKAHQFDFWIGDWEVTTPDGQVAGRNEIVPLLDGCVLMENWVGTSGSKGTSYNFYNPRKERWQQFWVWQNGTTLETEGGLVDGSMVLEGESLDREGKPVVNRITFYDNPDGTVRQHWEISRDGGETWRTAFDGLYRKSS
ncbi:MAG: hypothetical protein R3244_08245 [Thermoanaerobaculia bacterium]|nr:hypothetical protein [Thermoanaerobaculia bacterium]